MGFIIVLLVGSLMFYLFLLALYAPKNQGSSPTVDTDKNGLWFYSYSVTERPVLPEKEKKKSKSGYVPAPDKALAREIWGRLDLILRELGEKLSEPILISSKHGGYTFVGSQVYTDDVLYIARDTCTLHVPDNLTSVATVIHYKTPNPASPVLVYELKLRQSFEEPQVLRDGQWVEHLWDLYMKAGEQVKAREELSLERQREELHKRYGDVD